MERIRELVVKRRETGRTVPRDYKALRYIDRLIIIEIKELVKQWLDDHNMPNENIYIDGFSMYDGHIGLQAIGLWNSYGSINPRAWMNKLIVRNTGSIRAARCTTDASYLYKLPECPLYEFKDFVKTLYQRLVML